MARVPANSASKSLRTGHEQRARVEGRVSKASSKAIVAVVAILIALFVAVVLGGLLFTLAPGLKELLHGK